MNAISPDVCCLIASRLNDVDRVAFGLTCTRFYRILKERNFFPKVINTGYQERSDAVYKNLYHSSPSIFNRGFIIRIICVALLSLGLYHFERNMLPSAPLLKAILNAEFKKRFEVYMPITIISPMKALHWDNTSTYPAIPLFSTLINQIYLELMKSYENMEDQVNFLKKINPKEIKIMGNNLTIILNDKKNGFRFFFIIQAMFFLLGLILYDRTLHPRKLNVEYISDGRIYNETFESKWIQEAIPNNTLNEIILRIGVVAIPFFSILNTLR